jgi:hypothetical protein
MAALQQLMLLMIMVGMTGFEPATSRTPSVRATRLRHIPSGKDKYLWKRAFVNREGGDSQRVPLFWKGLLFSWFEYVQ